MNVASILLWGFVATVALTAAMSISHGVGLTRISIPFLLGTILTPDRDRALVVGTAFHVVNGWMFAFLYAAMLESIGWTTWWLGAGIGLAHALFVLAVGMPLIPGFHPRMVSEITARRRTAGCSLRVLCAELRVPDTGGHDCRPFGIWRDHRRVVQPDCAVVLSNSTAPDVQPAVTRFRAPCRTAPSRRSCRGAAVL